MQLSNTREGVQKGWVFFLILSLTIPYRSHQFEWLGVCFVLFQLKESGHLLKVKKQLINAISYLMESDKTIQGHR